MEFGLPNILTNNLMLKYMELIPRPHKVQYEAESKSNGKFVIGPLYPGYGITIGNMLRRVLLSSIPGAAITTAKIKGADHEFTTIAYVKEDLVDVVLNIKKIKLRVEPDVEISDEQPLVIKIEKKGEGKVTAGDIKTPSQVEIINKDLVIATLTDEAGDFEAEFTVGRGRGYLPVESFKGEKLSIGHMAVDAIFTPINQVSMNIEKTRVGEMTNWDKLILMVETDGSVTPEEAFKTAVNILFDQLDFLKNGEAEQADAGDKDNETAVEKETQIDVQEEVKEDDQNKIDEENGKDEPKKKRGRPKK